MDDRRTEREGSEGVSNYTHKDAARDVLRAIVVIACATTVIGLIGTFFQQPSGKMNSLPPLQDRLVTALYMGPLSGGVLGAVAGTILASFRYFKSLFATP